MSMRPQPWPEPSEEIAAAVRAMYSGREVPLPVAIRDQLGELFADEAFGSGFAVRGKSGWSPGRLALVMVLQMAENLTDRQAAEAVREKISWKYALGMTLADPGFDASVLSATVIDVHDWAQRYGARVDSWRLPTSQVKRKQLAQTYGTDALALLRAVYAPEAPDWLSGLPAVEVLRRVLVQNYCIRTHAGGREVITRREADTDGLPPGRLRISSPYDTDTRWAAKGEELVWNGYKVHLSETCHTPTPTPRTPATTRKPGSSKIRRPGPRPRSCPI